MCGRFALIADRQTLGAYLNRQIPAVYTARYNIAPTTPVMAQTAKGLDFFSWGLVPSWAKDIDFGNRMFNARVETVAEKPSFKHAFKRRRCLIPASGFYEWANTGKAKQPYFIHLDQALFSFAGIWEHWQDGNGNEWRSCSILTTEAAGNMVNVHHRMPVVLPDSQHAIWLDHRDESIVHAANCIAQRRDDFELRAVSTRVNNSRNEGPELIQTPPENGEFDFS